MRMRFAQNTCSTRSGNSFHDEISSKTRSGRNEFFKASFKMNQPETKRKLFIWKRQHDSCLLLVLVCPAYTFFTRTTTSTSTRWTRSRTRTRCQC
ncbi:unnamed protein product [Porites evermanni]|uniref:Uncharacterized protein n=1 Tax=Porites evermanni TaxID=104178 RepID=A0ABN8SJZ7_9CNID|nr:unnamed protein product [Porites evermanni]